MKAEAVEAKVISLLPNGIVKLKLANQDEVLAHPGAASKLNFVRMRPGDRVQVELSPHDRGRGRIVRRLENEG